jgi:hypothetical protein
MFFMDMGSPAETLKQFISEMNAWEIWAKEHDPRDATEEEWQAFKNICNAKLDAIFDKFCTPKKRPFRRQCDFRDPPEYQPDQEDILEVNTISFSRAEIITQEKSGLESRNKYVVLKRNGIWLLDNKQWFDDINGTWQTGIL